MSAGDCISSPAENQDERRSWVMRKRTYNSRKGLIGFLFAFPAVLYFLVVYTYPFIQTFLLSFFTEHRGVSSFVGLENYKEVLTDSLFWKSLINTAYLTLISVPITIVLALLVAVLLDKSPSILVRNTLQIASLLPMMMSLVAASLIFQWIFDPVYGILNELLVKLGMEKQPFFSSPTQVIPSVAIITIWIRVGFSATILLAGLQSIPTHYYEAALIDGASPVKSFFKITLPLLNSQIVLVCISEIIFAVKAFDQVFITTGGGPANSSRVIVLHLYETAFKWFDYNEASTIAILLFVLLMIISIFQWVFMRKKVEY